jgi:hypothetical protein
MSANYSQHELPGLAVSMFTQKYHLFMISFLCPGADMKLAYCREQEIMMNIRSRSAGQVNGS